MLSVQTQSVLVLVVVLGLGAPLMAIIVSILEQLAPRLPIPAGVGAHTRQPDRGERAALLRRARAELGSFRVWGVFWFASVATLAATALVTTQSGTAAALLPGAALFLLGLWLLWAEHRLVRQRALMLARRSGPRSARAAQRLAASALGLAASPAVPIRLSRIPRGPSAVPASPGAPATPATPATPAAPVPGTPTQHPPAQHPVFPAASTAPGRPARAVPVAA